MRKNRYVKKTGGHTMPDVMSTSQIAGLLGIPNITLQKYIREFGDYFSETARQHNRGRRYNAGDINNLLLIRQMKTTHAGHEAITRALATNTTPEGLPVPDIFSVLAVASHAESVTDYNVKKVERLVERAEWKGKQYIEFYGEMRAAIRELRYEQQQLKFEMLRLKFIFQHPKSLPTKPFSLRSFWEKFRMWTQSEYAKDLEHIQDEREKLEKTRELYLKDNPGYQDDL
jgi:DNA-binding transcriptional MerR regulator